MQHLHHLTADGILVGTEANAGRLKVSILATHTALHEHQSDQHRAMYHRVHPDMCLQALKQMRHNPGVGRLLAQAALREHNRLVDAELVADNLDKAAWLFRQETKLHASHDPRSEDLALLTYQFATLQYTR